MTAYRKPLAGRNASLSNISITGVLGYHFSLQCLKMEDERGPRMYPGIRGQPQAWILVLDHRGLRNSLREIAGLN